MAEPGPAHRYGMTKVATPAASAWADWAWSSLDVMTTGVTAPPVMAVKTLAQVFARSMSSWCVAGSGPSRSGSGQQLAAHPVQLADVAPAKTAQVGAQGGGHLDRAAQCAGGPAGADATSVIILSPVFARPAHCPGPGAPVPVGKSRGAGPG